MSFGTRRQGRDGAGSFLFAGGNRRGRRRAILGRRGRMRLENLEDRAMLTAGPGGIGDTTGASDLSLWLTPDSVAAPAGVQILQWTDASGSGNHATGIAGIAPIAAAGGATFNGANQYLTLPSAAALGLQNSDYEIFFVATSSSGAIQFLIGGTVANYEIHLNGASGARFIPEAPFGLATSSDIGVNTQYTNGFSRIYDARVNAGTFDAVIGVDGQTSTDVGVGGPDGDTRSADGGILNIGRRADSSYYFAGTISEVIVVDRSLNAMERASVNNYLQSKYNTALIAGPSPLDVGDLYSGDLPGNGNFDFNVFGVGRVDGSNELATNASGGLTLSVVGAMADGQYIFAGHNAGAGGYEANQTLTARKFYVQPTGGLNANLAFDLSDMGIPAPQPGESYQLVFSATAGGPYAPVAGAAISVAGDVVSATGITLGTGYYALQRAVSQQAANDSYTVSELTTNWINPSGVLANDVSAPSPTIYADTMATLNPVGYWKLNEPTGSLTAINSGSAGSFISANYNLAAGGAQSTTGLISNSPDTAVDFDGVQNANGDFIFGSGLNGVPGGNPFANDWTISAWFTRDATNAWASIFSNNTVAPWGGPILTFIDGTNQLGINGAGITANNVSVDLGGTQFGKTIFATLTKTGGNAAGTAELTVRVYMDGQLLGTATGTNAGWNLTALDGFYIGRHYALANQQLNGKIDEVAIFNRALSAEEIEKLFQANDYPTPSLSVTEVEGNPAFATTPITTAGGGVVTMSPNGTFNYDGSAFSYLSAGQTVADSFTYQMTDALSGQSTTATVNLTVVGVNDAPVLGTVTLTPSVNEGGVATLTGSFTDDDLNDSHFLQVNWGDGTIENLSIPFGQRTFSFTHTYVDDSPSGTSSDNLNVTLRLTDNHSLTTTSVISYWNFDEASSGTATALDQVGTNHGTFGGAATHTTGIVGLGALNVPNNGGVVVGNMGGVAAANLGIAVEALIRPTWSGAFGDYDEIFRKEDGGNRILFSFQNDANNPSANPAQAAGPVLSLGLNVGGVYQELDMRLNVDLSTVPGGNPNSGTIYLLPPGGPLGPHDVVLRDGNTHHVIGTYDQATGEKAIWIDGIKRISVNYTPGSLVTYGGGAAGFIGATGGFGEPFTGVMDEVAIYNRGLTNAEIAARAANALSGGSQFGFSTAAATITVNNVAPVVQGLVNQVNAQEGLTFSATVVFNDPGLASDTYTASVSWGDGSPSDIIGSGSFFVYDAFANLIAFNISHVFADDAVFPIAITINDDDSGSAFFTSNLAILNAPPTFTGALPLQVLQEGQAFMPPSLGFNDLGTLDFHTATIDWGDGNVEAVSVSQIPFGPPGSTAGQNGTLNFPSHTYLDEGTGVYTATVTLTDDNGGSVQTTFQALVSNAAPVVTAGGNAVLNEGSTLVRGGSFIDVGVLDGPFTATVDFGDGSGVQPLSLVGNTFTLNHTYQQNGVGPYNVTVTVTDNDGGIGTANFQVTVNNVAPAVDTGSATGTAAEGIAFTRAGSYLDLGVLDTHTATVDYGDGSGPQALTLVPGPAGSGTGTFNLSHVYADNGVYTITVVVFDDAGDNGADTIVVTVSNAAPVVTPFTLPITSEGVTVNLPPVLFTDAGAGDTHTATINWGDGTAVEVGVVTQGAGFGSVAGSHVYADNGFYLVTVTVTDDDLQSHFATYTVEITNALPTFGPVADPQFANEGEFLAFLFPDFNDLGTLDTHTATVDWGDGSAPVALSLSELPFGPPGSTAGLTGTLSGSHLFDDNGTFTVTVTLSDDDEPANTVTSVYDVIVANVAPDVIAITGLQEATPGYPIDYTFYASDPSAADLAAGFTFYIDWGDGNFETVTSNPGEDFVVVTHIFTDLGDYTISATAEDKDGDIGNAFDLPVSIVPVVQIGEDVYVGGTQNSDIVQFSLVRGGVMVRFNNVNYGAFEIFANTRVIAFMQDGNDKVTVGNGLYIPFELHGGLGNDYLAGGGGDDSLFGDEGSDTLLGGRGNDLLDGGADNDKMDGGYGDDILFGGDGADSMTGGYDNDTLYGDAGNDRMDGSYGNDVLHGGDDNDTMQGGYGNDILLGDLGNDRVLGGAGHDVLIGGAGLDNMNGDSGDDLLLAGNSSAALLADDAALLAIVAAWAANKNSAIPLLGTITNDSSVDALYGSTGIDWFYASATEAKDFKASTGDKRF